MTIYASTAAPDLKHISTGADWTMAPHKFSITVRNSENFNKETGFFFPLFLWQEYERDKQQCELRANEPPKDMRSTAFFENKESLAILPHI